MMRGQGATEYLVLLAVVLIVALVSVALLGFFPGMASDAQMTQSQTYWQSAQPIAISESAAKWDSNGYTYPYIRLRNTGAYPIRITAVIGGDGLKATQFWGTGCGMGSIYYNMTDYLYLGPGEETYFSRTGAGWYGTPCDRWIIIRTTGSSAGYFVSGASAACVNSTASPGIAVVPNFGFEYILGF